jgi:hypothetical protein
LTKDVVILGNPSLIGVMGSLLETQGRKIVIKTSPRCRFGWSTQRDDTAKISFKVSMTLADIYDRR